MNFNLSLKYSPERGRLASWNIGQENAFWYPDMGELDYTKITDSSIIDKYSADYDMVKSFQFLQ